MPYARSPTFKSLIWRIVFLHIVAVAVVAIFLPLVLFWLLNSEIDHLHRDAMRAQAEVLAERIAVQPDGSMSFNLPESLKGLYSEAYGRYQYEVRDEQGRVLFSSHKKNGAPVAPSDTISGAGVSRTIDGRTLRIQVAEDLAHRDVIIDDIVAEFFKRVGWITLPILLLLLAIDIVIFRRALRPLLKASEKAKEITPKTTDVRLSAQDIPSEILPLVQAVNQALDRLEAGFRVQREFTADAAHELRTPLTVLRSRIDALLDRSTAKALHNDIEGMARIVSQLLDIAELETFSIDPSEKADLRAICAELAEFAAPLAIAQDKSIALSGTEGPVWINGNAEMLSRAIRNLVENAINHSPPGTTVEIVVDEAGMVHVLDEGPGIKDDDRELIFRRFWRRDRRRAGGAGLGLSIVQRIAEAHAAAVEVENRPTGGANFSLRFGRAA